MTTYELMLNQLRDRAKLMPYEDGMREMVTLGNAAMVAMSLYEQGKRDAKCLMRCCEGLPEKT